MEFSCEYYMIMEKLIIRKVVMTERLTQLMGAGDILGAQENSRMSE